MNTPFVAVDALTVRFGERVAVNAVTASVNTGETIALVGANGSGKSTLLSAITGLLVPDAGSITMTVPVAKTSLMPVDVGFRSSMGVVFQSPSVDGTLTARENIVMAGRIQGLSRKEARSRATELLTWARLADRGDEITKQYSGGMRRRLDIARALVHRPALLVLDEPTTGLDIASVRDLWELLDSLTDVTILVATHDANEAERCDRVWIMHEGRLVADEMPEETLARLGGDTVELTTRGDSAELSRQLASALADAQVVRGEGSLTVHCSDGPAVAARLFELTETDAISELTVRRPSLSDAVLALIESQRGSERMEAAA